MQRIPYNPDRLADYCQKQLIRRLSFFGSILRDDFNERSDVDVLVEFEPGRKVGYFDLVEIQLDLATILDTDRQIDLRTPGELSRYFREEVINQSEALYDNAA